jgi:hypothetical protein
MQYAAAVPLVDTLTTVGGTSLYVSIASIAALMAVVAASLAPVAVSTREIGKVILEIFFPNIAKLRTAQKNFYTILFVQKKSMLVVTCWQVN